MIRKRRNAYLAALVIFIGTVLICFGAVLPSIKVSAFGIDAYHVSLVPSGDVDPGLAAPFIFGTSFFTLLAIVGLALARRRGWGIAWRLACFVLLLFPLIVVVDLWNDVITPTDIPKDDLASPPAKVLAELDHLPFFKVTDATPAPGLWILTLGCLLVLIGLFIPAKKNQELVIRDTDPGYRDYNPHIQRFQQDQARAYEQQYRQEREVWRSQASPPNDPYDAPRYYGNQ